MLDFRTSSFIFPASNATNTPDEHPKSIELNQETRNVKSVPVYDSLVSSC